MFGRNIRTMFIVLLGCMVISVMLLQRGSGGVGNSSMLVLAETATKMDIHVRKPSSVVIDRHVDDVIRSLQRDLANAAQPQRQDALPKSVLSHVVATTANSVTANVNDVDVNSVAPPLVARRHSGGRSSSKYHQAPQGPIWFWSREENCLQRSVLHRQRLRVLCLGDSITYGNGSHMHSSMAKREPGGNYPLMLKVDNVLRNILCPNVRIEVENLGFNGCSAQEGKRCYRNTKVYATALRKVKTADVVVLILGTNDSKDYNWKGSQAFEDALASYVDEIRANSHPKIEILIGTPPPVFPNTFGWKRGRRTNVSAFNIRPERLRVDIRDSVMLVAEHTGVTLLDLYHEVETHIAGLVAAGLRMEDGTATQPDLDLVKYYYHDGVHPYAPTHEFITSAVRDAIVTVLNSTSSQDDVI